MSLCCSLRGLPGLLSRQKAKDAAKQAEDRAAIIADLQKTYDKLDEDDGFYLETRFLGLLSVRVEPLNFKADGDYDMPPQPIFFQPMPRDKLLAHPINNQSENSKVYLTSDETCIEPEESHSRPSRADLLCAILGW